MNKKLIIFAVAIFTFSSIPKSFAYDFQSLDNQVLNGQISQQEAQQTINDAVKCGKITQDELNNYYAKKKDRFCPCAPQGFRGHGCPSPEARQAFEKKLKDAGISKEDFEKARAQDPQAVEELLKKHGIERPMFRHGGPSLKERQAFEKKLKDAGISKEDFEKARAQGPQAVDELLKKHGIERPMFRHGAPSLKERQAFEKKLKDAGISKEDFEKARAQGHQAVEELLKKHGIERPMFKHHCGPCGPEQCPPPAPEGNEQQ